MSVFLGPIHPLALAHHIREPDSDIPTSVRTVVYSSSRLDRDGLQYRGNATQLYQSVLDAAVARHSRPEVKRLHRLHFRAIVNPFPDRHSSRLMFDDDVCLSSTKSCPDPVMTVTFTNTNCLLLQVADSYYELIRNAFLTNNGKPRGRIVLRGWLT
jgi:hypothetical protein